MISWKDFTANTANLLTALSHTRERYTRCVASRDLHMLHQLLKISTAAKGMPRILDVIADQVLTQNTVIT
jgi:hypothetical protein